MILYSHWCSLTITTRNKIAEAFGIKKKGATQVDSNMIKHDGYLVEDIESALNVEAMQKFLASDEADISKLWQMVVDKVEGRGTEEKKPSMSVLPPTEAKEFSKEFKQRRGRPKKNV